MEVTHKYMLLKCKIDGPQYVNEKVLRIEARQQEWGADAKIMPVRPMCLWSATKLIFCQNILASKYTSPTSISPPIIGADGNTNHLPQSSP